MTFADGLHIVATPSHSFENCCKKARQQSEEALLLGAQCLDEVFNDDIVLPPGPSAV